MYHFYIEPMTELETIVKIEKDTISFIPADLENIDYQTFLAWVAESNTPSEWTPKP